MRRIKKIAGNKYERKKRIEYRSYEKQKTIILEHEWKNKSTRNYSSIANQNGGQRRITGKGQL